MTTFLNILHVISNQNIKSKNHASWDTTVTYLSKKGTTAKEEHIKSIHLLQKFKFIYKLLIFDRVKLLQLRLWMKTRTSNRICWQEILRRKLDLWVLRLVVIGMFLRW